MNAKCSILIIDLNASCFVAKIHKGSKWNLQQCQTAPYVTGQFNGVHPFPRDYNFETSSFQTQNEVDVEVVEANKV